MKSRYSKPIIPQKFQDGQLADLQNYHDKMKTRAARYLPKATISVDSCLICGSKNLHPFLEVYGSNYLQCSNCTHVTLQQQLPAKELKNFYSESTDYAATYSDASQLEYRLEHIAKPKVDFVMQQLQHTQGGRWLDIGCAIGDILRAVEMYPGWKAEGLEISTQSIATGKQTWGVQIHNQQLSEFHTQHSNQLYRVVSAFGYYGLVSDPLKEITLASQLLEDDGYLVIGDTNAAAFSSLVQQSYPDLTLRHLIPPNILHGFTETSLLLTLKKLHCKPIAIWRFGLDFFEFLKYLSLLQPGFQNTPLFAYLSKQANAFQAVIDRDKKADYMLVVAQKK